MKFIVYQRKIGNTHRGSKRTEETKEKMRKSQSNRKRECEKLDNHPLDY